jgi:hypothetical protein
LYDQTLKITAAKNTNERTAVVARLTLATFLQSHAKAIPAGMPSNAKTG